MFKPNTLLQLLYVALECVQLCRNIYKHIFYTVYYIILPNLVKEVCMIQHMRLCPHPIHHHSEVVNIQIHCFLCWLLVRLVWCVGNGHSAHVCTGVHFGNHSTMGHTCTYVGIRIDTLLLYRLGVVDPQACKWSSL